MINVTNHRVLLNNSVTIGGFHYNDPRMFSAELRYRFHFWSVTDKAPYQLADFSVDEDSAGVTRISSNCAALCGHLEGPVAY